MSEPIPIETAPQRGVGRTIFKNAVAITLGNVVLKAANFLFGVYVVRQLGDDRFGQYSIVLAFVGLFQILAELGMSQYVMRQIAQDRSRTQSLFWNLVALRCLLGAAGMLLIPLAAAAYGYSSELVLGVLVYTASFLLSAFAAPLMAVLAAYERLDHATLLTVLSQIAFIALGTLFLFLNLGFIWLIVAGLASIVPQIVIAAWVIRRERMTSLGFQIDPRSWPGLIRAGLPFGIISLALTIAFSIDTVMLSMYVPESVVGWYNIAYGLVRSLMFFISGFSHAMVPSLTRTYVSDTRQVERWYHRSVKFILLMGVPMAVGGTLVAFPLVNFLYAEANLPAAPGLQILIWDVPLLMFASFCGNMTTVVSEERAAARIYSINAVANVILNAYAIPRFGLVGASFVTVITDLIGALQFHFLLRRKLHLPGMMSVLLRVALAGAGMGASVALAGDQHLFVQIGIGAGVYGALVLALRLIDADERALVAQLVRLVLPSKAEA